MYKPDILCIHFKLVLYKGKKLKLQSIRQPLGNIQTGWSKEGKPISKWLHQIKKWKATSQKKESPFKNGYIKSNSGKLL